MVTSIIAKECPFCGNSDLSKIELFATNTRCNVECTICGAEGPHVDICAYDSSEEKEVCYNKAIDLWNKRATP